MNPFDKIRQLEIPDRSFRWYQEQIRSVGLATMSPARALRSDLGEFAQSASPGEMYLFLYDPKFAFSLPYYDTFPLVVTYKQVLGGFMGINLHYLPPMLRMQILNKLLEYTTTKGLTESTRFKLKWSLLNNAARFPGVKSAVKHYLNAHVQSRVLRINPKDWKLAISLPLEQFEKASKSRVYAETVRA